MNVRLIPAFVFGLALTVAAVAQDAPTTPPPPAPPAGQSTGQASAQGGGSGRWQGQGQRGGGRGMGGGMGMGRGLVGTVTEVAADHYTVKTDAGEIYTVHYSANTRMIKQTAQGPRPGQGQGQGQGGWQQGRGRGEGEGGGGGYGGNPPQTIKPTDIKVGDAIAAMGEIDATAKSVGAVMVAQLDPERAKQMREMQANYGKSWLMGKITAVDGVKVIILGSVDNAAHSFLADENTSFRKRRDPITLADLQVGDIVRVEGAAKDGSFLATTVDAMGAPPGGNPAVPRSGPPQ
jgi:Domain of unknown function (DUF5666)